MLFEFTILEIFGTNTYFSITGSANGFLLAIAFA